jgi:hypothetical protein
MRLDATRLLRILRRSRLARAQATVWVAGALWLVAILGGLLVLTDKSATPTDDGAVAERWPLASRLLLDLDRPTLVLFLHPRCPCSRASVRELERLVAEVRGKARVTAVFIETGETGEAGSAVRGDLWSMVAAIPGVHAVVDRDGREGARFGVATSGHAALFDTHGSLLYSGGLTAARGHEGDSVGVAALRARIEAHTLTAAAAPVFGCLLDQASR